MKRLLLSALIVSTPLLTFAQNYAPPTPTNEAVIQAATAQQPQSAQPVQQNQQAPQQAQQPPQAAPQYQQAAPQYQQAPQYQPAQQAPIPLPGPTTAPVGDPAYYGQVDLVNNTVPPTVYATPVVAQPAPPGVYYQPVYMRVPAVYYQNWPQYCGYYNACFYPVFFVQESWYVGFYSPWYRRYYPYGRPGFVARVYYNPHYGGYHGGPYRGDPRYYNHGDHRY